MKKGDLMMVAYSTGWGAAGMKSAAGMKKGDLVVVVDIVVPGRSRNVFAQVLHPTVGVCYIEKKRLEPVNEAR